MANQFRISVEVANAEMDALAAKLVNGKLMIYNGTQPATVDTALSGNTLLATLTFGAAPFAPSSNGVLTANAITSGTAVASAPPNASFFRATKSDGVTAVCDGSVGTSGCDLNLGSVAIQSGAIVSVSSMTITQPRG
jgi:hypothetical protein